MRKLFIGDTESSNKFWGINLVSVTEGEDELISIHVYENETVNRVNLKALLVGKIIVFHNVIYDGYIIGKILRCEHDPSPVEIRHWNDYFFNIKTTKGEGLTAQKELFYKVNNHKWDWSYVCSLTRVGGIDEAGAGLKTLQHIYGLGVVSEDLSDPDFKPTKKFLNYFENDVRSLKKIWYLHPELKAHFDSRALALKLLNIEKPNLVYKSISQFIKGILSTDLKKPTRNPVDFVYEDVKLLKFREHLDKNIGVNFYKLDKKLKEVTSKTNVVYKDNLFKLSRGGIHSANVSDRFFKEDEEHNIALLDFGSMYPNIILQNPSYFDFINLNTMQTVLDKRFEFKRVGDKLKANALKLILNSVFGQLKIKGKNENTPSAFYNPDGQLLVCLYGHYMVLKSLDILDDHLKYTLIQTNTDGLYIKYKKSDKNNLNKAIAAIIAKHNIPLDFTPVESVYQINVNGYFAKLKNGELISKGLLKLTGDKRESNINAIHTAKLIVAKKYGFIDTVEIKPLLYKNKLYYFKYGTDISKKWMAKVKPKTVCGVIDYAYTEDKSEADIQIYEDMANHLEMDKSENIPYPFLSYVNVQLFDKEKLNEPIPKKFLKNGNPLTLNLTIDRGFKRLQNFDKIVDKLENNYIMAVGHFSDNHRTSKKIVKTNSGYLDLDDETTPDIETVIDLLKSIGLPPLISYYTLSAKLEDGGIKKQRHLLLFNHTFTETDKDVTMYDGLMKYISDLIKEKAGLLQDVSTNNIGRRMYPKSKNYPEIYYGDRWNSYIDVTRILNELSVNADELIAANNANIKQIRNSIGNVSLVNLSVEQIVIDFIGMDSTHPNSAEGTYGKFIKLACVLKTLYVIANDKDFNPRFEFERLTHAYRDKSTKIAGVYQILKMYDDFSDITGIRNAETLKYIFENFLNNAAVQPEFVKETLQPEPVQEVQQIQQNIPQLPNPNVFKPVIPISLKKQFTYEDINFTKIPEIPDFPIDILPIQLQKYIIKLKHHFLLPINFTAAALLSLFSILIGNTIRIQMPMGGWVESACVWMLMIAKSTDKKSPVLTHMLHSVLNPIQEEYGLDFKSKMKVFHRRNSDIKRLEKQNENRLPEDLIDVPEQLPKPSKQRIMVGDTTIEKLGVTLEENPKGVITILDELKGFFNKMDKQKDAGIQSDYVNLFDGKHILTDRITRDDVEVWNPFFNLIGAVQPEILYNLYPNLKYDGFINRFLFNYSEILDFKHLPRESFDVDKLFIPYKAMVNQLIADLNVMFVENNFKPTVLNLNCSAKVSAAWYDVHDLLDDLILKNENLSEYIGKFKSMFGHFIIIVEIIDRFYNKKEFDLTSVNLKSVENSAKILKYFIKNVVIFDATINRKFEIDEAINVKILTPIEKLAAISHASYYRDDKTIAEIALDLKKSVKTINRYIKMVDTQPHRYEIDYEIGVK